MQFVDLVLQRWRARVARPWVPTGARVLDVGCFQGKFLRGLGRHIAPSVGLDPLAQPENCPEHALLPELFAPPLAFPAASFDAIVMLATLEHIHEKQPLGVECFRLLRPGGRVIITVPSPWVDPIVHLLCRLRLADGMSLEEHHGFDPKTTPEVFVPHGFELEHSRRFQFGLNHLYVFHKTGAAAEVISPAEAASRLAGSCAHA